MKTLVVALACVAFSGAAMADLALPSTSVECTVVEAGKDGKPDLTEFNKDLAKKARQNVGNHVQSVSVSPHGRGEFLACVAGNPGRPKN